MASAAGDPALSRPDLAHAATRVDVAVAAGGALAVVAAELTLLAAGLVAGTVAGIVATAALLSGAARWRGHPGGAAAAALAVVPLLRLLSISVPSLALPAWSWHAEIGIPVIVATITAARFGGVRPGAMGLRLAPPAVVAVALVMGLGLGLIASGLVTAGAAPVGRSSVEGLAAAASLLLGGAIAEGLLFRGLLQGLADEIVPGHGVLVAAGLCTLVYLAAADPRSVLFAATVALGLGLLTHRYGSILPAVACHAGLLWSQVLLWPAVLG